MSAMGPASDGPAGLMYNEVWVMIEIADNLHCSCDLRVRRQEPPAPCNQYSCKPPSAQKIFFNLVFTANFVHHISRLYYINMSTHVSIHHRFSCCCTACCCCC